MASVDLHWYVDMIAMAGAVGFFHFSSSYLAFAPPGFCSHCEYSCGPVGSFSFCRSRSSFAPYIFPNLLWTCCRHQGQQVVSWALPTLFSFALLTPSDWDLVLIAPQIVPSVYSALVYVSFALGICYRLLLVQSFSLRAPDSVAGFLSSI